MRLPGRLFFVFICLLICVPAWAQTPGSPVVYVSSGTAILSVTTATGVVSPLFSNSSADYEGLVVGPNNDPSTSSTHPYLLYACDPTNNKIIRFDPNNVAAGTDTVYQGTAAHKTLQQPQCGRLDSAGDLIVNSEAAGSGTWKIAGVATLPLGTASFPAPVQLGTAISAAQAGQGVTQKFVGDLLAVDQVGNQVVRSTIQLPASSTTGYGFGTSSAFIKTNLSSPFGIARNNAGQVYVSEHTSNKKGDVQLFDSTGTFVDTCVSSRIFGNEQPNFLGVAEDGTLYVAAASSSAGFVWSVTQSAGTCTATQLATTSSPLTGIALPPTQTSITMSQSGQGTLSYNFGSSLFNLTTGACSLPLTKTLVPTPALTALAGTITGSTTIDGTTVTLNGGIAAPYLGDGGFATKYTFPEPPAPPAVDPCPNNAFEYLIAAFTDQNIFSNPWIIRCEPAATTSCASTDVHGIYFLGGFLPEDLVSSGTGGRRSDFFLANMNLNGSRKATLNLESPLTQVAPPKVAGTFSSGSTISVKFKFTPTITNAVAILAVAQVCQPGTPSTNDPVCGPNGQASVFPINVINIDSEGSSTVPPPVVTSGNQQYSFSLSLKGYAPGIYSLSVIVLSNNSSPVTVIVKII
jgi:hypothetical protein